MRTSSPNMSLIYFLIFSLPLLKSRFYDHVLCMQAHGLNKRLSLLVNLYQMSSRHLCQGSLKNSNFSNTCDCRQAPRQKKFKLKSPVKERLWHTTEQWSSQKRKMKGRTCKSAASSAPSPWDWQWCICSVSAQGTIGNRTWCFHIVPANVLASFHPCIRNFLLSSIFGNTVAFISFFKASLYWGFTVSF